MAPKTPSAWSHTVGRPRPGTESAVLIAEGRLVEAVAAGTVLCGSADELARRLGVSAGAVRAALQELTAARWIVTEPRPDGRLTVRWERRQHLVLVPVDRRRPRDHDARRRLSR